MAEFAAKNQRWNLIALLCDAGSFFFGVAMLDSGTVLPVLLKELGASNSLIGSTVFIQVVGFALPGILAAHYIHGRANHKKFMLLTGGIGRAAIFTMPFSLILFGESNPGLALALVLGATAVFWMLDGFCAVSWTDIVAKTILPPVRGFFFGVLQVLGGAAALTAAGVVSLVITRGTITFPENYAILAGCWAIGGIGSFLSLASVREPAGEVDHEEAKPGIFRFLANGIVLFRRNRRVRTIVVSRWLLGAGSLAGPFYVLYANNALQVPLSAAGYFLTARCCGRISAGPLWGWVSNRWGPATAVRWVALPMVAAPAIAFAATPATAWTFFAVFFLLGLADDGLWTSCQNTLYDSVTDRERPLAVGAVTVALAPCAFYGVVGGAMTDFFSFRPVVVLAIVTCACGACFAWHLPKPARVR